MVQPLIYYDSSVDIEEQLEFIDRLVTGFFEEEGTPEVLLRAFAKSPEQLIPWKEDGDKVYKITVLVEEVG